MKHIAVFEHDCVKLNQQIGEATFDEAKLLSFQKYYGEKGVPYFSLMHNGVRFNEYVGVMQVGGHVIEVLPKADKKASTEEDKTYWRDILIDMLQAIGTFSIHAPTSASLNLKSNSILDLYFKLFVTEVEYLLHTGLVKKYRKTEGNVTALKGNLQFAKHIQQNLTHQERFYVRHTIYDTEHMLHVIIYKTILLLKDLNNNPVLQSRICSLLLSFPEMPDIQVSENTFTRIVYNRKTERYRNSIGIARLLLLNYHPDLSNGKDHVLALMFDMNKLWEQFVYVSLRKHKAKSHTITAQTSKFFWKPAIGNRSGMRPDIVLNKGLEGCVVLDTKWKNLNGYNPTPEDLRQMYVYHEYYNAKRVALIYPGRGPGTRGKYLHRDDESATDKSCSVMLIDVVPDVKKWQEQIWEKFYQWYCEV